MKKLQVHFVGMAPLIMHADTFADPLNAKTKAHKMLTSKRKKTDDDQEAIAYSEWCGAMYYDKEIGPYIPGANIDAVLQAGGAFSKLKTKIKAACMTVEDKIKLEYKGTRDMDALYAKKEFVDARTVKVGQARLMRYRPKFLEWELTCTIAFHEDMVDKRDILKALIDAGVAVGLCDYRPRYGKFMVEEIV